MSGDRIAVESDGAVSLDDMVRRGVRGRPDVSALASLDGNKLCVMVWHYHDDDLPGPAADIQLVVDGLAASASEATVQHYRIDEEHSNAYTAWQRMGSPQQPSAEQYAQVEKAGRLAALGPAQSVPVKSGTARLLFNPALSMPHRVPWYGEIITARWAYEALAVYEFVENDYEKLFYDYEKQMSLAEFKRNYWVQNLKNKANYLTQQVGHPEDPAKFKSDLVLLRNELMKENAINKLVKYKNLDSLTSKSLNADVLESTLNHLDKLNKYYIILYNKANDEKDALLRDLENTPEKKEKFLALKMENYNEKLFEFVTNRNEVDRIVEFKGELFQKENPVYLDSDTKFVKAHFYAPRKMIFGFWVGTLWVNIAVIWVSTVLLYLILYFRLLKRLFDSIERIADKFIKPAE